MITDVDESSARAIIEHAKNLSGDVESRHVRQDGMWPQAVSSAGPAKGKTELSPGEHEPVSGSSAPPAQFPSESGHWYDPKTGNQIELPPRTQARTAIKRGFVPGVTSVTKVAHREAIQRWMVNRAIKFTAKRLRQEEESGGSMIHLSDEILASDVWSMLNADSEATTGRGKELHAAIEASISHNGVYTLKDKWLDHLTNLYSTLNGYGINLDKGNTEHGFATSRYGGKIDWHNDEWLLDFKTRENLGEDTRWAVMRKGNTRATKIYDLKNEAEQAITSDEYYIEPRHDLAWPQHAQQLAAYAIGLSNDLNQLRRCANVFIGVEDAQVVFHEWSEKDLLKGWRKFEALLNVWWCDYEH